MALYNPLAFTRPTNSGTAGLQLLGNALDQRRQRGVLQASEDKKLNAFKRLQGLEQLGQYQPDELENPEIQAQMNQARMESLGSPQAYYADQMKQQQAEARNQRANALSDPKVQELMGVQKNASLEAKGLVSKYLNTDSLEEKQAIEQEYLTLSKVSNDAGAELGSNPSLSGYHHTKMPNFFRMVEGAVKGRGTQDLAGIEKETKEAQRDKVKAESNAITGRLELSRQMQTENLAKIKEDRGYKSHNQITKVLKDSGLSEPSTYDSIIRDAQFAVEKKNIFTAVKLLSNVIEPGLSVTEGEVDGYTVGGTSKFNKFLQRMGGAGVYDMNRILELLTGIAQNRKGQAQKIIGNQGRRVEPTEVQEYADEEFKW